MRDCDGCTICCKVMKIRELEKPGNIWCAHCVIGSGCKIYAERPESCREYECLWLKTQRLDRPLAPELRPDKSKVVIGTLNAGEEVVLYVTPDRPDAWKQGAMRALVAEFQSRRIGVHVCCNDKLTRL